MATTFTERLVAEVSATGNVADGKAEKNVDGYTDAAGRARDASGRFTKSQKEAADASKNLSTNVGDVVKKLTLAAAGFVTVGAAVAGAKGAARAIIEFEQGLVGVGKTANIEGKALAKLGREIEGLSGRIPASTAELLSIAQAAGQLGVKGSPAILAFTSTIAQLGSASDLAGDEAATALARILTVTGESAESVGTLASVIVALGNNFAATESQIARHTGEVARATAVYEIGSAQSAALATTLAAFGVQAELSGSAVGRSFRTIESAVKAGGKELDALAAVARVSGDELAAAYGESVPKAFGLFLQGLRETIRESGNAAEQLGTVGLKGEEILKVLPVLAKEYDTLARAQSIAAAETGNATALTAEAEKAYATLGSQLSIVANDLQRAARVAGAELAPSIATAAASVRQALAENEDLLKGLGRLAGLSLEGLAAGLGFVAENLGLVAAAAGAVAAAKLPALITSATAAVAKFNATLLLNPLVAIAAGAAALAAVINTVLLRTIRETTAEIDQMTESANRFRGKIRAWGAAIDGADVDALRDSLSEARMESAKVSGELEKAREKYGELTEKIKNTRFAGDLIDRREALNATIRDFVSQQATLNAKIAQMEAVLPMTEAIAQAFADAAPEVESAADGIADLPDAIKAVNAELAELETVADLMTRFGLSAEDAGDAARLKLAEGVNLADDAVVQLVKDLKEARAQLDSIAVSQVKAFAAANAPQQLGKREFDPFAQLGGPGEFRLKIDGLDLKNELRDVRDVFQTGKEALEALADAQHQAQLDVIDRLDAVTGGLGLVADIFGDIGGSIAGMISKLAGAASGIAGGIADIQAGGLAGGPLGALQSFGGAASIFQTVSGLLSSLTDDSGDLGMPTAIRVTGGQLSGAAVQGDSGAVSSQQAVEALRAWRLEIDAFRVAVGGILQELPEISTRVTNDGEEVELTVGGVVHGIFSSMEEAFAAGLRIAVGGAEIQGVGEAVGAALGRVTASTMDELLELIPVLREVDDVNAGLTASYSAAKVAEDAFRVNLDLTSEALLRHGVSLEDMIDFREREIAAQQELLRAGGAAFAGVSSGLASFGQWLDAVDAFGIAQEEEAARRENLAQNINVTTESTVRFGQGLKDVDRGAGSAGEAVGGFAGSLEGFGRIARSVETDAEDVAAAAGQLSDAFVELIRDAVSAKSEVSVLEELLAFQEAYGVELAATETLQSQIAELEFRGAQIRIALLVEELAMNAELLGLTQAQINVYRQWAEEVAAADFAGVAPAGGGGRGRGGGRRQRREQAAEGFRDSFSEITRLLEGATPSQLAYAAAVATLTEQGREGRQPVEDIAAAVAGLAELQLLEIAEDWTEAAMRFRETDLATAVREAQEKYEVAIGEAAARAGENPEVYQEVRMAIERGLEAELGQIGREGLAAIGGARVALQQAQRDTIQEIRLLVENADALGTSLRQVSNAVRDGVLPGLFDILESQARRVGDADALEKIQARRAAFELRFEQLKFELLVKQLEAADALTPALEQWVALGRGFFTLPTVAQLSPGGDDGAVLTLGGDRRGGRAGGSQGASATRQIDALARALKAVASQTEEWLDLGLDPFQVRLDGLTDTFTDLAAAVLSAGGSLDDVIDLEEALMVAREDALDQLLSGVDDRLRAAELEAPGALPAQRLATLQSAFADAIAAAQASPGEDTFGDAFELFDLLSAFAGEQFGGGTLAAFVAQLQAQLASLSEIGLEDLPSQEELLAEISAKLTTVDTSVGGVGTAVGGVADAITTIAVPGIPQSALDALTGAIGDLAVADLVVEFGATALADLAGALEGVDIGTLDFQGVITALGGIGTPLGDLVSGIGPEGFQAFVDALKPIVTNTGRTAAGASDTVVALTTDAGSAISRKLTVLNQSIGGSGGASVKSLLFDIKGNTAGIGSGSLSGFAGSALTLAPPAPVIDEALVLNTLALEENTGALDRNSAEMRTLSSRVVALEATFGRRARGLSGGVVK